MSEVKKIATRDSYGNTLVELGKEHENLVVLDADLAGATKTAIFKKAFRSVTLIVVSLRATWQASQQVLLPVEKFRL